MDHKKLQLFKDVDFCQPLMKIIRKSLWHVNHFLLKSIHILCCDSHIIPLRDPVLLRRALRFPTVPFSDAGLFWLLYSLITASIRV